jgi:arsenate reductase (thioredoxin)
MPAPDPHLGLNSDNRVLHRIVEEFQEKFSGVFPDEIIERIVFESYTSLARTSKIHAHLNTTTRHYALGRLESLAKTRAAGSGHLPVVLFLDSANDGRSQLAAALLDHIADGRVRARSVGLAPAGAVNPQVVEVLREAGIDASHKYPKPLTDDVLRAADVVITFGVARDLPLLTGKNVNEWVVPDPTEDGIGNARTALRTLEGCVRTLLEEVTQ